EMRFCKKIFAAALCALVLLPEPGCARTLWKRALLKMTEKYDKSIPLKGGNPRNPSPVAVPCLAHSLPAELLPTPWHTLGGTICACLHRAQLPNPLLDWLVQPKPRWLGGNGWLLDGPEEVLQAEACSTTEDGDEPLHCPTGYECHIINPGNTAEGIPNRGQCIKLRGNPDGHSLRHKYYKEYFGSNSNNLVGYVKNQQKHLG
ncbi:WFDC1 protein, partial [Acrocephalus arundinaceus]|nr:WFDC1 protein [Acrocephalus arundinaceus]